MSEENGKIEESKKQYDNEEGTKTIYKRRHGDRKGVDKSPERNR